MDAIRHNGQIASEMVARLAEWDLEFGADGMSDALDVACVMRVRLEAEIVFGGFAQVGYKNICKAKRLFRDAELTLKAAKKMRDAKTK